ncbi:MAG TPA: hypothetical protein VHA33_14960 [Candidatus Angelobacter sp.]|nr:hypothetical protein [Candidatus Angelobacter sp.]
MNVSRVSTSAAVIDAYVNNVLIPAEIMSPALRALAFISPVPTACAVG